MLRKGFITISRPSFGSGKEVISIKVGDDASHKQFLELEVGLREFALILTGQGHLPCQFDLNDVDLVGRIREYKQELILSPTKSYYDMSDEELAALLTPFETDGWVGCIYDLKNGNNHSTNADGKKVMRIGFVRYVDPPEEAK